MKKPETVDPSEREDHDDDWQENTRTAHRAAGTAMQMALNMAITMVVFVFGGMWLDKKFGLSPWLTVVGAAFGFVAMIYYVIKLANSFGGKQ